MHEIGGTISRVMDLKFKWKHGDDLSLPDRVTSSIQSHLLMHVDQEESLNVPV
jgi:hypothetical protein